MSAESASGRYLVEAAKIVERIATTQLEAIDAAAAICTQAIGTGGLVHAFGTGHSRIPVEELFPRHGSFPGFHPIVELSLTNHTQIVGANGQRQAMWLEKIEGFGEVILRNFAFGPDDAMLIFSNSGVTPVVIDVALGARERGLPVIAVVSFDHSGKSPSRHSSGKKLIELADIAIDNCTPAGDAMVSIDGLDDPVGPGSTIGFAAVANAIKSQTAEALVALGTPPLVLSSSVVIGDASAQRFDDCYDEQSRRVSRLYDWPRS
ncbi:MAG: SIS domain-containing protein [Thermomicrobiales bacterium]|nr:SIS domain-containing protein [Thermomicrobiales bacterium]